MKQWSKARKYLDRCETAAAAWQKARDDVQAVVDDAPRLELPTANGDALKLALRDDGNLAVCIGTYERRLTPVQVDALRAWLEETYE